MKKSARAHYPSEFIAQSGKLSLITDFALYLSVALVLARAMMLEILREPVAADIGQAATPRGPGAAVGIVLDLLCCTPALLVLIRGTLDRSFVIRRSLAHMFMLLLAIWMLLSPLWASDRFAAAINASHFVSALVLLWAMSQLVREWRHLRVVAAAGLGLLLVLAAQALIYRYLDLPELLRHVEQDWPRILQERGWEPDSFVEQQFKRRIAGGELMGFNSSPNTFGALLVMLGIVCAGLMLQRIRDRDEYGWALVIGLALLPAGWAIIYTGSRAALATPILAAMLLGVLWNSRDWLIRHRRVVFFASVALIMLAAAAAVAHGVYYGTLFHDSLTFRWKYWVGAARIFVMHPIFGVGYSNFGLWYLGTRLPEAAEEINDPHNLFVRVFVELGVIGGVLTLAWLLRLWWELTRPVAPAVPSSTRAIFASSAKESVTPLLWLSGAATVIAIVSAIDFAQQWEYGFIEVLKRLLYMALLLLGLVMGTFRSTRQPQPDDRAAPWVLYAILVAVGIFLIHNLIDFSLFDTGATFVFAMFVGAALGIRLSGDDVALRRWAVGMLATAGIVLWLGFAVAVVAPVVVAEHEANRGDAALRGGATAPAAEHYRRAFERLWIPNHDYAARNARAMILAAQPAQQVRSAIRDAIDASPMTAQNWRLLAEFELRQPRPDADAALSAFERVVQLDPSDVHTRLDFAAALEHLGQHQRAREQYRTALELNAQLDPAEPERLSPAQVTEIEQKLHDLR